MGEPTVRPCARNGLNAYFAFGVVMGENGIGWEIALFAVFLEGILFPGTISTSGRRKNSNDQCNPYRFEDSNRSRYWNVPRDYRSERDGLDVNDDATLVQLTHELEGITTLMENYGQWFV